LRRRVAYSDQATWNNNSAAELEQINFARYDFPPSQLHPVTGRKNSLAARKLKRIISITYQNASHAATFEQALLIITLTVVKDTQQLKMENAAIWTICFNRKSEFNIPTILHAALIRMSRNAKAKDHRQNVLRPEK